LRILLVRHGITKLHTGDRFWGRTDIALSNTGIKQAGQLRNRLSHEKLNVIYSSPLRRARSTAEIIAAGHKVEVIPCDDLSECNFGYIEGLTFEEIKKLHPALARELSDGKAVTFPGGETLDQLNARVRLFLKRLKKHKPGDTALVVAHGGPIRLIICDLLGLGIEHWTQFRLDRASLSIVDTYPESNILSLLNDTSHLEP
jgi:alpha-ribazole phosphatase